jgi:hypothetical protein
MMNQFVGNYYIYEKDDIKTLIKTQRFRTDLFAWEALIIKNLNKELYKENSKMFVLHRMIRPVTELEYITYKMLGYI